MSTMLLNIPAHTNCRNCGDCCTVIPASRQEVRAIRAYLEAHPEIKKQAQAHSHRTLECPFRDNEAQRCIIYPVRPAICRLMGVCAGMECSYGNSAYINGDPFLADHHPDNLVILNELDWT
jgi:Fe-S-cluster containining protein